MSIFLKTNFESKVRQQIRSNIYMYHGNSQKFITLNAYCEYSIDDVKDIFYSMKHFHQNLRLVNQNLRLVP